MPESTTPAAASTNGNSSNGKSKSSNGNSTNGSAANGNGAALESHGTAVAVPDEISSPELKNLEVAQKQNPVISGTGATGWTPGFRAQTASDRALKFARHFTQSGQDPFSTSNWEKRTASITGENGKSVFEQKDCEMPAHWSQLATNVVVSKYFRGPMNTPQRETSVRQVIGRVADTIHSWGTQGGYFATPEDAQSFRDELVYLLLHQYGSFNSPVWFNLGVKGARAQCSACFINDVHDDMESIMELAATEARLFKGGSGAGSNLWRIRSSKEQLSGGGIASGPISFMRGWDAFAGAIKCLTPDAYVYTQHGLQTIGEVVNTELEPGFHADESLVLATKDGEARISQVYVSPSSPTLEATLSHSGLQLRGTKQHPVLTLSPDFRLEWKALCDLQAGDHVAVSRRTEMWPDAAPSFADFAPQLTWAKKDLLFPSTLTPELARLLGYMVAEGCMDAERFRFCNADEDVFDDFLGCVQKVFGADASQNVRTRVHPTTGVETRLFEACWPNAVRFLKHAGLGFEKSAHKSVPWSVRQAPRALVVEFLRAYFEGDGHVSSHIYAASASKTLLGEVQLLLLNMGMMPHLRAHPVNGKPYWSLYLRGREAFSFAREVDFVSARKRAAAERLGDKNSNTNIDTVPFLADLLRARANRNGNFSCHDGQTRLLRFGFFNRKAGSALSYSRLRATPQLLDNLQLVEPEWAQTLEFLLEREFFFDTVASVEAKENAVTFDFTVPGTHSFIANGIVNHNSGGTCLAPYQRVYTENGPVAVEELAHRESFIALSFDPPAGRYKAKRARAWLAGNKRVVRVETDKGQFDLSFDHPVKLSSGEYVLAGDLKEGQSLFACSIDSQHGHLRVHLRDGQKGKEFFHRLIASDVLGEDLTDQIVHHRDGDKHNNAPDNLEVMTQAEHAALHGRETAIRGEHVFQTGEWSHAGSDNGVHRDGSFWSSPKAADYRELQGDILTQSGRATQMQREAARQKSLNTAFRVLNAGWPIETFDQYARGRKTVMGRIASLSQLREQLDEEFGSFDEFRREVARQNHRVLSVSTLSKMDVYDVEVECPTPDDKSPETGHNFLIWHGDEPTGSGVIVANTRRAAKMVILNVDHPDIGEFIVCKANEEKKAWALIDAGYNGGFNVPGGAYDSVAFQNANHSVRVTDDFMRAAENGAPFQTRAVTTGKPIETLDARQVLRNIAEATHICGDPGMQYDTVINDWHTCINTDRIYASNPCSEFMFLDCTSCNLASINLLKFYDFDTGHFDAKAYVHASETFITAQEIIVSFASYPTAKIAENSELFRPLGLGYCNIGALLMAMGLAYDSDEGRAFAGALTAIMTGAAYRQSARIARNTGAFEGYALNREPMLRVIGKHRDAVGRIDHSLVADNVLEEAHKCWDEALLLGQKHGYRNSQTTVLAPTGTISFMMDADTTGVEPDIALVKYKKLVGGGLLKIVNQTVPAALRKLGYDENEIQSIVEYIDKNDTIEGAPGLEDKHLSVFDCAFKAMNGVRSIHHMGHVKMMAAAQPFLSGAISKTVNMPQDCTVDEIMDAYIQSWKLGVKAVAIYRDNSKRTQPLSTSSDAQKADKKESEVRKALRRKLSDERMSITHKFSIAGQEGYFMVGLYEDGSPGEIFIKMSKEGSTISGLMDSFAVAISMCLQYGVPLRVLVNKFSHTRFEPSGYTTNRDIPIAKSLMDYIFRWFDQKFHPNGDNGHFGKQAPAVEEEAQPKKAERAPSTTVPTTIASLPTLFSTPTHEEGARNGNLADAQSTLMQSQADSPPCPNCGAITVRSGSCYKCNECGTTTGCG